jgi:hypothetical protein
MSSPGCVMIPLQRSPLLDSHSGEAQRWECHFSNKLMNPESPLEMGLPKLVVPMILLPHFTNAEGETSGESMKNSKLQLTTNTVLLHEK